MAHPVRFELTTYSFGGYRSIHLSYGCVSKNSVADRQYDFLAEAMEKGRGPQSARIAARYWEAGLL
jgi:hypothetical protein